MSYNVVTTSALDGQLASSLDVLACALDRIASAIPDLTNQERAMLARRLRRVEADVCMLSVEVARPEHGQAG